MGVSIRRKTKNGPWFVFVSHQSKRKSYSAGSKANAQKMARVLEGQLALGKAGFMEQQVVIAPKFSAVCQTWLETVMPSRCKPATQRMYRSVDRTYLQHLPFRDKAVDKINTGELKEYLFKILETRSASTTSSIRDAISGVFEHCKDHRWVETNPARGIRLKKPPQPVPEPYDQREIERLLAAAQGTKYYQLWALLTFTGCRLSEGLAAKHQDFDLDRRVWQLCRSFSDGQESTPKSGKGRTVDLSNRLVAILATVKQLDDCDWLFPNDVGKPLSKNNVYRRGWRPLLVKAKLRHNRIHDLRHSYASRMIAAGANLYYIQRQLGHADIQILINRYAHVLPDHENNGKPVDLLDDAPGAPTLSVIAGEARCARSSAG